MDTTWTNLVDIVDVPKGSDEQPHRVVSFGVDEDGLTIAEACDDWFAVTLDAGQIDQLVVWLQAQRAKITGEKGR
jgi:hypothetical protein